MRDPDKSARQELEECEREIDAYERHWIRYAPYCKILKDRASDLRAEIAMQEW